MSTYGYGDRRTRQDQEAIQYLLNRHRDSLMKKDNERRRKLKEENKGS